MTMMTETTAPLTVSFPCPASREAWITPDSGYANVGVAAHSLIVTHATGEIEHRVVWSIDQRSCREDVWAGRATEVSLGHYPDAQAVWERAEEIVSGALEMEDWQLASTVGSIAEAYAGSDMAGAEILDALGLDPAGPWSAARLTAAVNDARLVDDYYVTSTDEEISDWLHTLAGDVAAGEDRRY